MFNKRTSRRTSKSRERMLELRVNSPRILFCDAVKLSGRLFKFLMIALVVVAIGVVGRIGYQKFFIDNQDFALKEMSFETENGGEPRFLTRARVIEATAIEESGSIFAFDVDEIEAQLLALPEISSASVNRRLPGTLKIKVTERIPVAWLACPARGIEERNIGNGLLVDESGIAFPCATASLASYAANLPVVFAGELPEGAIVESQKINHEGLKYALEFAIKADISLSGSDLPDWVMVKDEITLEMRTVGGTRCTVSYFEQDSQIERLKNLSRHARDSGRQLATINLIPKRFVPVTYITQN